MISDLKNIIKEKEKEIELKENKINKMDNEI